MFRGSLFVGLSSGLLGRDEGRVGGGGGVGGQIGDSEEGHIGSDIVGLNLWSVASGFSCSGVVQLEATASS